MTTAPEPEDRPPSGREPVQARSAYGLRLRFALFGVVVGVVFATWAIVWAVGDGPVNALVPIIAIVFLAAAAVNVLGVLRARNRDRQRRPEA